MKKLKVKGRIKSKIVEDLALPKDLMLGECVLQIIGNSVLYIENYKSIIEYDSNIIRVKVKYGSVIIEGNCLCISYYSDEEMKITGNFYNISFCSQ